MWLIPFQKSVHSLKLGVEQEETEKLLQIEGQLPNWLKGVLVRNSSIPIYQEGKQISHEFDGLAMLHGFAFNEGKVFYTNRFIKSQQHHAVVNKGTQLVLDSGRSQVLSELTVRVDKSINSICFFMMSFDLIIKCICLTLMSF